MNELEVIVITRTQILPGVRLTAMQTDKFKSSVLSVNLLRPLDAQNASVNAILPPILRRGTQLYPDMERYAARQDTLYGARISGAVRKKGEVQCIGLLADFVDGRYTPDGDTQLSNVLALLCQTLLNPTLENGGFRTDYVDGERKNLVDRIDAQINEKGAYAKHMATAHMCRDEAYGVDRLGDRDTAAAITREAAYAAWQDVLATSAIEIFYCGSASCELVAALLTEALKDLPRGSLVVTGTPLVLASRKPRTVEERLDVSQGKLVLGLRTNCNAQHEQFPATMVANMIYGGALTSKLFVNVREKLSLCYYASSMVDKWKGVMFVQSGIEFAQYERALEEILHQLQQCKVGAITAEELAAAQNTIATLYNAVADSPAELEEYTLGQSIAGVDYQAHDFVRLCRAVTMEQVVDAACAIELDTTYFLRGLEA